MRRFPCTAKPKIATDVFRCLERDQFAFGAERSIKLEAVSLAVGETRLITTNNGDRVDCTTGDTYLHIFVLCFRFLVQVYFFLRGHMYT